MSTDLRELLQLAAKAIGGKPSEGEGKRRTGPTWDTWEWYGEPGIVTPVTWRPHGCVVIRPHLDDGDSRSLQVALGITLEHHFSPIDATREGWVARLPARAAGNLRYADQHDGDSAAAARLAVLCAAAEIGRQMP